MKMIIGKAPIFEEACKLFGIEETKPVYMTYGDCIYNHMGVAITDELIRHEETHIEQQDANSDVAKLWWERYLRDPEFRLQMEAEAYGAQYAFYCQKVKDKEKRFSYLRAVAGQLADPMYGSIIKTDEAVNLIRQYAEYGRKLA